MLRHCNVFHRFFQLNVKHSFHTNFPVICHTSCCVRSLGNWVHFDRISCVRSHQIGVWRCSRPRLQNPYLQAPYELDSLDFLTIERDWKIGDRMAGQCAPIFARIHWKALKETNEALSEIKGLLISNAWRFGLEIKIGDLNKKFLQINNKNNNNRRLYKNRTCF